MDAAQIDGELPVDEHPHVVIADELQGLTALVLKPVTDLAREAVIVTDVIVVAAPQMGDLGTRRRRRPPTIVQRKERRRQPTDGRGVAPLLRVVVHVRSVGLHVQGQRVQHRLPEGRIVIPLVEVRGGRQLRVGDDGDRHHRAPVRSQDRLHHPFDHRPRDARLEVRVPPGDAAAHEVAEDHGHRQVTVVSVADLLAVPAGLQHTGGRAAIAR